METPDLEQWAKALNKALDLLERLSPSWTQFFLSALFMGALLVGCCLLIERRLSGNVPESMLTRWLPLWYDVKLIAAVVAVLSALAIWLVRSIRSNDGGPSAT